MASGEREDESRVVITGMGAIASIGSDLDEVWAAIAAGRHGILPIDRFSTELYAANIGALIPGWNDVLGSPIEVDGSDPSVTVALHAAREAIRRAGIAEGVDPARIALCFGTSTGGIHARSAYEFTPPDDLDRRHRLLAKSGFGPQTAAIADALGILGPRLTISTACSSSTHAIAHGRDLILSGTADVVLAGGVDVVIPEVYAGFHAMGALSPTPCAPFSEPVGMSVGEGAGFVVLERSGDADRRGAEVICAILGAGFSSDGHHPTAPDPTGAGVARAIAAAMADAGISFNDVDYVNAHGTGTEANDPAEWRALVRALGERASRIPVSSTKSYLGHTLGAAGVLELIVTVLGMRRGVVPPTLSFTGLRGQGPADPVAEGAPRATEVKVAISTNSAFGGANAALIVGEVGTGAGKGAEAAVEAREAVAGEGAEEAVQARSTAAATGGEVVVLGVGAVGPHGFEGLEAALAAGKPLWAPVDRAGSPLPLPAFAARVPSFTLSRFVRGVDARGLDAVTCLLAAAAALAIKDCGVKIRGKLRERAGLMVGASRLPWDSADEFWGSIRARGFGKASAPAFSRIVMNAGAGAVSRLLSLLGPLSVIASGPVSGLYAAIVAADLLGRRGDADLYVTGAADDLGDGLLVDHAVVHRSMASPPIRGAGAACLVLGRADHAAAEGRKPIAQVRGHGIAAPDRLADAVHLAMRRAGARPEDVDLLVGSADGTPAAEAREIAAIRAAIGPRIEAIPRSNPASVLGVSEALAAFSLASAALSVRSGRARSALVISADEIGGSAAMLLGPRA